MKKLYKLDSRGKIRVWSIYTMGSELIQESGLEDGKVVIHKKTCNEKNIGKTNATSSAEQAKLEMKSCYLSKLTEGYFTTKDEAKNELVILPMLAKDYKKEYKKVDWNNSYVSRKYDGMRCIAHCSKDGSVKLVSRDGRIIENMEHIIHELSELKLDIIFDGELWTEGTFQDNMKLIKKYRKGLTETIKYNIYDIINVNPFSERFNLISNIYEFNDINNDIITFVEHIQVHNENDLITCHKQFISEGFEGTILRTGNNGYQINKRSSNLLKYKDFSDMDLPIIDITPNESNLLHGTPHFNLNGKNFKAGCKMSHDDRADLLLNKQHYIGQLANVKYFELTDDGIPRFPVMIGIHLDR